jgi:2-C-methyl-D-erythritol 2,4-cyclodiphosphate synthase
MTQVGFGYDSHRFARGRKLVLGGVTIPHPRGLKGHSDADVVLHAAVDAILGACALGDIGTHFPDSDPRYRGAPSLLFLEDAVRRIRGRFRLVHLDVTLLAEEPRIGPYKQRMRGKLARATGLSLAHVSVKAKTNEGMGFVGRREGLAAVAVATVERKK